MHILLLILAFLFFTVVCIYQLIAGTIERVRCANGIREHGHEAWDKMEVDRKKIEEDREREERLQEREAFLKTPGGIEELAAIERKSESIRWEEKQKRWARQEKDAEIRRVARISAKAYAKELAKQGITAAASPETAQRPARRSKKMTMPPPVPTS